MGGLRSGTFWLIGLLVLLAAGLAVEALLLENWRAGVKTEARADPRAGDVEKVDVWAPAKKLVKVGEIKDMIARPLFTPTRRPPPPPEKPEPKEPEPKAKPLKLKITSIVVTPNAQVAFARGPKQDQTLRLVAGETYRGWTVKVVWPDSVTFRSDRGEKTLPLRPSGPPRNHAPPMKLEPPEQPETKAASGDNNETPENSKE